MKNFSLLIQQLDRLTKTGDKVAIKYIETSSSSTQLITSEIETLKIINALKYY